MRRTIFILLFITIFYSCKKEYSCESCFETVNKPPDSKAGNDLTIYLPVDSVTLDGSASTDHEGPISSWQWTKILGPSFFSVDSPSVARTKVRGLVAGFYLFELRVTDGGGLSDRDTVKVLVIDPNQPNHPPVAEAGPNQVIGLPITGTQLDGSLSFDPDNNIISYNWSRKSGPTTCFFSDPTAIKPTVTDLTIGVYVFELKVTDAWGLFSTDSVKVTVLSGPPPPGCDLSDRPVTNAQLVSIGSISQARIGMTTVAAGNKILFAGASLEAVAGSPLTEYGSTRVDIFDVATQSWSTAELSEKRSDIAAVAAGNKIFFAGGRLGDGAYDQLFSTVDIYDAITNTWTVASLSEPRAYVAATAVGNKVMFAGGEKDWAYNTSSIVDIYDFSSNSWSTATLSEPRAFVSAVTCNGKAYFAGGHSEDRWYADPSDRIDIYDAATNTWSTANLSRPMGSPTGVVDGQKIYWTDGCHVEIRDTNSGVVSTANLSMPANWLIVQGSKAVLSNNKIVFFKNSSASGPGRFDIYDISTNTWSIGQLSQGHYNHSIIELNNVVYVAGGFESAFPGIMLTQAWKLEF